MQTTAGALFDANRGSLAAAFKEIRGYQVPAPAAAALPVLEQEPGRVGRRPGPASACTSPAWSASCGRWWSAACTAPAPWPRRRPGPSTSTAASNPGQPQPGHGPPRSAGCAAASPTTSWPPSAGSTAWSARCWSTRTRSRPAHPTPSRSSGPPSTISPTALESYLNLPRGYANRVPVSEGRTARQVLLDQLALLQAKLGEVLDAVAKGDSDRSVAHGHFLEDRFGRPEVELR